MKMTARLLSLWESVRASYWFVPLGMSLASLLLSVVMVWLDGSVSDEVIQKLPWLYTGTPGGARTILATIASSMIGLAGVVFSITIVALTLASGQFGSRLLRNFMRDPGNQITLGTFLAAFLYCLMILRRIHGSGDEEGNDFVPQLSMLVAALVAVAGLGVLIFFIHHAAASIQAPNVIAAVSRELFHAIDTLYPEKLGEPPADVDVSPDDAREQIPADFEENSVAIVAGHEGYLERIEPTPLMAITRQKDLLVRMERRPGHFVQRDTVVLRAAPHKHVTDDVKDVLQETFAVSAQRSLSQDAEFAIEQLVEVAVRALSPGINDPFTAIQCVDRLGAALSELATRRIPTEYRLDEDGRLRVLASVKKFEDFADTAFNQIRQYSARSLDVLIRMLEAMERIAEHIGRDEDRQCLQTHADMVYALAADAAKPERDRCKVEDRYAAVKRKLQVAPA